MRRLIYTTLVIALLFSLVFVASVSAAPTRADRGAWAPNVAYAVNDTVTYGGSTYKCLQAHTSLIGWEPPNVPALWQLTTAGPTATRTNTSIVPTATRTNTPVSGSLPDLVITSITYVGSTPACANNPRDNVVVSNNGSVGAGTFVVAFSSQTLTVSSLAAGQSVTLSFSAIPGTVTATADSTNVIAESNESNNTMSASLPAPTQAPTCTPSGVTATPTRTPTRTNTPVGPTNTPTRTATRTATATATTGGGTSCWTPWVSSTAYNGGAQVSYNGQNYQAAFWTQGDQPDTHSGPAGSGQPWVPMGACGGGGGSTATPTRTPTIGPSPTNPPPGSVNYNAAPYVMPRDNNPPDIASVISASGVKAYTLAFILANGSSCSPAWDGNDPISSDTQVQAYINTIRANGGDVVPSVGGYGGTKLGQVCADGPSTYNAYNQVVTKYNIKAIDFDIEEPEIENAAAVARELYAAKQFVSQGLNVSVTMPVTTSGLNYFAMCSPNNTGSVLSWAQTNSFTPTTWNIMPFDGGFAAPMGTSTVNVAEIFHGQLKTCFGWSDATAYAHSGLSLMNGRSDTGEYTYQADFTTIINYAHSHGLKRLTFWSVNRDRSCNAAYGQTDPGTKGDCSSVTQNPWDFTKLIGGF